MTNDNAAASKAALGITLGGTLLRVLQLIAQAAGAILNCGVIHIQSFDRYGELGPLLPGNRAGVNPMTDFAVTLVDHGTT